MRAYDLLQDEFSVTLLLTLNSFTFDSSLRDILNVPLERLLCCRCSGQRELSSSVLHTQQPRQLCPDRACMGGKGGQVATSVLRRQHCLLVTFVWRGPHWVLPPAGASGWPHMGVLEMISDEAWRNG